MINVDDEYQSFEMKFNMSTMCPIDTASL